MQFSNSELWFLHRMPTYYYADMKCIMNASSKSMNWKEANMNLHFFFCMRQVQLTSASTHSTHTPFRKFNVFGKCMSTIANETPYRFCAMCVYCVCVRVFFFSFSSSSLCELRTEPNQTERWLCMFAIRLNSLWVSFGSSCVHALTFSPAKCVQTLCIRTLCNDIAHIREDEKFTIDCMRCYALVVNFLSHHDVTLILKCVFSECVIPNRRS